jgi:hypothetical protein
VNEPLAVETVSTHLQSLREDFLARANSRRGLEMPSPVLASANQTRVVCDYLLWWVMHPNPAGTFAERTRWLRLLPGPFLLRTLFKVGYDGLVYVDRDRVIGHVFFHRRGSVVHGFSTAVGEPFDGSGYSVVIILDFLTYVSQLPGIVRARVGRGHTNVTRRFLQRLKAHERQFGWRVEPDGWVTFRQHADS